MKKKFLSILPLLFAVIFVNAQDITTYRGAFAPAPTHMWTDTWTNWDPQNTIYPATDVNVSGHITTNTTWTSNHTYKISGLVYVDTLITLTIQPGTVIRGDDAVANSSLVVRRGGKVNAEGTVCNPIVFTSNKAVGSRGLADWGGVILLGRATDNQGTQVLIEGTSAADPSNYHGGTDDNDNSGILKYVRIEFGGFVFAPNNEINGLTFGSVGRGTTIDYVQSSFINDDAFEWFGGAVNCTHLVAYRCLDDNFDTDYGFHGTVQYCLGVKDPDISDNPAVSTSEGFESDNDPIGTNESQVPKTSAKFYNVTDIGAFRCASNTNGTGVTPNAVGFRRSARTRRNTDLKIVNCLLMNNWRGWFLDGTLAQGNVDQDSLLFRNNIIAGDFSTTWAASNPTFSGTKSMAAEDAATRTRLFNSAYANDSVNTCSLLVNAWDFLNPDYRPNTAGAGAIVTDPESLSVGADLSPGVTIGGTLFTANQARDFMVFLVENDGGASSGAITITIPKPSAWTITVPGLTLSGTNQSGTNGSNSLGAYTNGNWNFRDDGTNIIATSKAGVVIERNGFLQLGLVATRKGTTSTGTNQNMSVNISGGSDTTPGNNSTVVTYSAN